MKLRHLTSVTPATLQLLFLPLFASSVSGAATSFVTLSQFQQINGFSASCTSAYNTPIPGCTTADFASTSAPCSLDCVAGLQAISTTLNTACKGTLTDPTTLIGLFFEGKGVNALCPVIQSSSSSSVKTTRTIAPQPLPQTSTTTSTFRTTTTTESKTPPKQASSILPSQHTTTTSSADTTTPVSTSASAPVVETSSESGNAAASRKSAAASSNAAAVTSAAASASSSSSTTSDNPSTTSGPAVFGGGAIPFTVDNKAVSAASYCTISRTALAITFGVCLWMLQMAL
ncbi:MAG: hypothetical protein MMC23_005524 [Stictis urceolatum]|nr:hypothetical protein [Stictis urceolata]